MGAQAPPGLLGIHTNFPGAVRPDVAAGVQSGEAPSGLDDEETRLYEKLQFFFATDAGFAIESTTHPQSLYGIADSPVGLAAWMLDHDATSLALISRVFVDGAEEGLTRDDVLDNITHYWLTNTGVSSGRLYWENRLDFFDPKAWPTADDRLIVDIPVAVSVFPDELVRCRGVGRRRPTPTHPLQQARQGRALRGLGAAGAVRRRGPHGVALASLGDRARPSAHPLARRGDRVAKPRAARPARAARPRRARELRVRVRVAEVDDWGPSRGRR